MLMDIISLSQAIKELDFVLILTVIFILILLIIGLLIERHSLKRELQHTLYNQRDNVRHSWRNNFWQGISTEFIGAAMTAFMFGVILLVFQQYQIVENDKGDVILQMSSPDNSIAIEAVRIASQKGWLEDGTMIKADLFKANLKSAIIGSANMANAKLLFVNLEDADLRGANLAESNIRESFLKNAKLGEVDFTNSNLEGTKLEGADLHGANLAQANLDYSNLQGANFYNTKLEETKLYRAILPDGTLWTTEADMERFTNPDHPDYAETLEKINAIRAEMGLEPIE